ncbi:MAG: serine hydrolase domain-containing protein [Vicinamibacterales bacterium]
MKHAARIAIAATLVVAWAAALKALQGPPPEIRALIEEVIQAANGNDEAWEAFAQKSFAPPYLKQQTPAQRAALHQQIVARFGTVARGPVVREGPDAPLQITIKGSKASGMLAVSVDDTTFRITSLALDASSSSRDPGAINLPPVSIDRTMTSDEIDRRLHDYFTGLTKDDVFSGVALVAKNGVLVFLRAYGSADRDKQVPNTVRTRFNIGSINKAFTQIAINQLIAAGQLSRADTLGKFYPDYPQAASRAATVDQLLNHRGGLADFFGPQFESSNKKDSDSNADYFRFVGSLPSLFSPGERNQYCNGCYIALGAIVEKVSGMSYEQYLADHVFARAEMTSTGYPRSDQPASDIALGYTRRAGGGSLQSNIALHGVTGSAAGGGYSTVLDLLTFVKAVKAGAFPGTAADMGIAGGAPGTSAVVESSGEWTVIVVTNFDPPTGEQLGTLIARALR